MPSLILPLTDNFAERLAARPSCVYCGSTCRSQACAQLKALDPLRRCLTIAMSAASNACVPGFSYGFHMCLRSRRQPAASRAAIRCGAAGDAHMRQVEQVQAKQACQPVLGLTPLCSTTGRLHRLCKIDS